MSDEDPLYHADVGETIEIEETETIETINMRQPGQPDREDRVGDVEVTSAEVVEREGKPNVIQYTWEGELTKALPENWDQEPWTRPESQTGSGSSLWANIASVLIGTAVAGIVGFHTFNRIFEELTINGQDYGSPSPSIFGAIAWIYGGLLVIAIVWSAIRGPGRFRG